MFLKIQQKTAGNATFVVSTMYRSGSIPGVAFLFATRMTPAAITVVQYPTRRIQPVQNRL
jgi:hypothetical protein